MAGSQKLGERETSRPSDRGTVPSAKIYQETKLSTITPHKASDHVPTHEANSLRHKKKKHMGMYSSSDEEENAKIDIKTQRGLNFSSDDEGLAQSASRQIKSSEQAAVLAKKQEEDETKRKKEDQKAKKIREDVEPAVGMDSEEDHENIWQKKEAVAADQKKREERVPTEKREPMQIFGKREDVVPEFRYKNHGLEGASKKSPANAHHKRPFGDLFRSKQVNREKVEQPKIEEAKKEVDDKQQNVVMVPSAKGFFSKAAQRVSLPTIFSDTNVRTQSKTIRSSIADSSENETDQGQIDENSSEDDIHSQIDNHINKRLAKIVAQSSVFVCTGDDTKQGSPLQNGYSHERLANKTDLSPTPGSTEKECARERDSDDQSDHEGLAWMPKTAWAEKNRKGKVPVSLSKLFDGVQRSASDTGSGGLNEILGDAIQDNSKFALLSPEGQNVKNVSQDRGKSSNARLEMRGSVESDEEFDVLTSPSKQEIAETTLGFTPARRNLFLSEGEWSTRRGLVHLLPYMCLHNTVCVFAYYYISSVFILIHI